MVAQAPRITSSNIHIIQQMVIIHVDIDKDVNIYMFLLMVNDDGFVMTNDKAVYLHSSISYNIINIIINMTRLSQSDYFVYYYSIS